MSRCAMDPKPAKHQMVKLNEMPFACLQIEELNPSRTYLGWVQDHPFPHPDPPACRGSTHSNAHLHKQRASNPRKVSLQAARISPDGLGLTSFACYTTSGSLFPRRVTFLSCEHRTEGGEGNEIHSFALTCELLPSAVFVLS